MHPWGLSRGKFITLGDCSPSGRVIRSPSPVRNVGQLLCESACAAPADAWGGWEAFAMSASAQLDVSTALLPLGQPGDSRRLKAGSVSVQHLHIVAMSE